MDIMTLTEFFKWCTIINGAILVISSVMLMLAGDFVFKLHGKWFNLSKETYSAIAYSYLGIFKVAYIIFNLVPFVALSLLNG